MANTDSNFRNLSCQLGGLTLNGIAAQGTARSLNVLNIDDSSVTQTLTKTITGKFIQINVAGVVYFLPLYQ